MTKEITAHAWTLGHGDKITKGSYGGCTIEYSREDTKNFTRVYYTRDTDFIHSFITGHNTSFTIIPNEVSNA